MSASTIDRPLLPVAVTDQRVQKARSSYFWRGVLLWLFSGIMFSASRGDAFLMDVGEIVSVQLRMQATGVILVALVVGRIWLGRLDRREIDPARSVRRYQNTNFGIFLAIIIGAAIAQTMFWTIDMSMFTEPSWTMLSPFPFATIDVTIN